MSSLSRADAANRVADRRALLARSWIAAISVAMLLLMAFAAIAAASGPPYPDPQNGRYIYDDAGALASAVRRSVTSVLTDLEQRTGARVVVYTQIKAASRTKAAVAADAQALITQWTLGGQSGDGAVLFWSFLRGPDKPIVVVAAGPGFLSRVDQTTLDAVPDLTMAEALARKDWAGALIQGSVAISLDVSTPSTTPGPGATPAPGVTPVPGTTPRPGSTPGPVEPPLDPGTPAGPPYPAPVTNVTVYDYAGILSRETETTATNTIAGIEARTGAEIVVYTQVKPSSNTPDEAQHDAIALIDQWGVGRKGFDDGMAILFDMDQSKCHGQVQLYAAPGYRAVYLTNEERQAIFDNDMTPYLRSCNIDQALLVALAKIDANATPEHAQKLQTARQLDAAMGLVAAPLMLVGLVGWAGWSWLRFGRDPVYLDDASVLMPAPPAGMTAPAAALLMEGKDSRRALTTAMVDLASRGELAFKEEKGLLKSKVGVQLTEPDANDARVQLNRRAATDPAEMYALGKIQGLGFGEPGGYVGSSELLGFGSSVGHFNNVLGDYVASMGWFREAPQKSIDRWSFRGGLVLVLGVIAVIIAFNLPSAGLTLIGAALIAASVAIFVISRAMPQRTMQGAMTYAMLAAYRRTLHNTLEQARSMDEVVASKAVPWLVTPDQAVVWGVALGLHDEIEEVLARSMEDLQAGKALSSTYFPIWYIGGSGGGVDGGGGIAPGLFSGSAIPDFGGMMSALGTIGNSPSSSGSGGSGGFSGGSSGGGGGGAGGGF